MNDEAIYDSSGVFQLAVKPGSRTLEALEHPSAEVLWWVQDLVQAGAQELDLDLGLSHFQMRARIDPKRSPQMEGGSQRGQHWQWARSRQVSRAFLTQELDWVHRRCGYCPIPLRCNGMIVQNFFPTLSGYHLAEYYHQHQGRPPGLSLLRSDLSGRGGLCNTDQTLWREWLGPVQGVRWMLPQRVAGMVARLRPAQGVRCSEAVLVLASRGQASHLHPVHRGVLLPSRELDWPGMGGLEVFWDASSLPTDLSRLKLVEGLELRACLEELRQRLALWLRERCEAWERAVPRCRITARQSRREMSAWLGLWGMGMVTGAAPFLPLPLLGLPWIVWHHGSRRKIQRALRERIDELAVALIPNKP